MRLEVLEGLPHDVLELHNLGATDASQVTHGKLLITCSISSHAFNFGHRGFEQVVVALLLNLSSIQQATVRGGELGVQKFFKAFNVICLIPWAPGTSGDVTTLTN